MTWSERLFGIDAPCTGLHSPKDATMGLRRDDAHATAKFGTFGGVFTPCTLTILGVIMFLRYGQVAGQAGLALCLLIVLISVGISLLTALSLSAVATNTRVKGGGAYYLISRSLGVEFGGAIGVVFFLAQAISVALYVVGFTEAFVDTVPSLAGRFVEVATVVNVIAFICVFIGAGWTIKVQYVILAILVAAIVSFMIGAGLAFDLELTRANMTARFSEGENFFTVFALFFPAVTGIMAGANMSGDLQDPARSIPRGTLAAVMVTGVVYVIMGILLVSARSADQLISNNLIIKQIAVWPWLIVAGVFAATLSSALGSLMGAPRILQAFGRDEVFRPLRFFAVGSGKNNEPRRATVLAFLVAQACVMLGDLNAIAPIITMFFMITYGTLNLATFYEAITRNPSYRPTFRFSHWSFSLLGAISCLVVMFLIDWMWAGISIVLMVALHWYIGFREVKSRWGDIQSGLVFERARKNLLNLETHLYHPKNWRPTILALSGSAWTRPHLAVYGHWLTAGHGVLTLAQVITGEVEDMVARRGKQEQILRRFIADQELEAFPAVVVAPSLSDGIVSLLQCHGLGGLRPNTVLIGWPNDDDKAESFGANVRRIRSLGCSTVALRMPPNDDDMTNNAWDVMPGTIDVWWRGRDNGELMLLLAHLLHQNPDWRRKTIRLLRIVEKEAARVEVQKHLLTIDTTSRISVQPVVIVSSDVAGTIQQASRDAAIVIMGLEPPEAGGEIERFHTMQRVAGSLPRVLFVNSTGGMQLES
jgi:amino acid transporter